MPDDEPVVTEEVATVSSDMFYVLKASLDEGFLASRDCHHIGGDNITIEATEEGQEPTEVACWVFDDEGLDALQELAYRVAHKVEFGDNKFFIALTNPNRTAATASVDPVTTLSITRSNHGSTINDMLWRDVEPLLRHHLLPIVRRNIFIQRNSLVNDVIDNSVFTIVLGGGSRNCGSVSLPARMWGNDMSRTREVINQTMRKVWNEGDPIFTPEGDEVGAYSDNTLVAYWEALQRCDSYDYSEDEDSQHYAQRMRDINPFQDFLSAFLAARRQGGSAIDHEKMREMYANGCSERIRVKYDQLCSQLRNNEAEISKLNAKIVNMMRENRLTSVELVGFDTKVDAEKDNLKLEFDAISKLPNVKRVLWRAGKLTVETGLIYAEDSRTNIKHELGEFRILINSEDTDVYMHNMTRKVLGYQEGMNAPHVYADGHACWGDYAQVIPQALAEFQWSVAIQYAIRFLGFANTNDPAGQHVDKWPRAREEASVAESAEAVTDAERTAPVAVADADNDTTGLAGY